jgi:hypothetical protein
MIFPFHRQSHAVRLTHRSATKKYGDHYTFEASADLEI